jgi:hypothetical protein
MANEDKKVAIMDLNWTQFSIYRLQYLVDGEWANLHLFYFRTDAEECGRHLPGGPRWRVVEEGNEG